MNALPLSAKIAIVVVILIVVLLVIFSKTIYQFSTMNSHATGKIIPNVFAIKTGIVNCYLVKGDKGYVMIDAGTNKDQVEKALQELAIKPEEIKAILLTHSDSDHTTSIPLFTNAQLYLPELEVQMIDGTTMRNRFGRNSLDSKYLTIKDNDVMEIAGYSIKCLATPGHTPGSMSYLFNNEYLFVGDTMSLIKGKAELFLAIYNMDDDMQAISIAKLANVPAKYVFTGHHGYSDNPGLVFEKYGLAE